MIAQLSVSVYSWFIVKMKLSSVLLGFMVVASANSNIHFDHVEYAQSKPHPRIFGGREATPHSLPYHVFLYASTYFNGALISQNYILTAAVSVVKENGANHFGAHNRSSAENTQVRMTSSEILIHLDFSNLSFNNLAIIQLPSSLRLTPAIKPIPLPSVTDITNDYSGSLSTISSFMMSNCDGTYYLSNVLNYVQVNVISNTECSAIVDGMITSLLCTTGEGGTCSGDGGALLVTDGVLIGIATFISGNCPDTLPSGFTRITSFLPWILSNTDV